MAEESLAFRRQVGKGLQEQRAEEERKARKAAELSSQRAAKEVREHAHACITDYHIWLSLPPQRCLVGAWVTVLP